MKKEKLISGKKIMARSRAAVAILLLCLGGLTYRLAMLQIVNASEYRNAAIDQYTHEIKIEAHRGSIFDRNMKRLAYSATVQTVFLSPFNIKDDAQAELISNGLSKILGVSKESIREKADKRTSKYQVIMRSVEEEKELEVRKFIKDNNLVEQVCLEEDTKRYYPYGELAAQTLGFTSSDNKGLYGIELMYDSILGGIDGRAVKGKDGQGNELPFPYESYIDAKNGQGVALTIDWTIQSIIEKYIKAGYEENLPEFGVRTIMMDVKTGEILGMASYGGFDLNNRNELSAPYQSKLDAFVGTDEEKAKYKLSLQYEMWKNKIVTDVYDPGSTFKIVTTAMGLEESVFTKESHYNCTGRINVLGLPIKCHANVPHGDQTVEQALINSCNPAFVQMGLDIGHELFEKYLYEFGYTERVGSDVLGEAQSIFYKDLSNLGDLKSVLGGLNLFSYCDNNPVMDSDENGNLPK
ncbi:MAG: penicillin-binding transpeptidase domain-containing protein, partial [Clostridia bacterium]